MKTIKKIAIAMVLLCVASCINRAEPEIHLLPKGFQGYVIIIFNDPNGQDERYEDDFRVYEIPQNGILRTKFSRQDGWIANEKLKYYYANNGKRTEVNYKEFNENATDDGNVYVFSKELDSETIRYIVSPMSKADKYYNELHKKLDELFPPVVQ